MIADGDPISMDQFTLGPRYGSEDMYRDMGIVPGSRVAFEKDGVIYTDTVESVQWNSPTAAGWPELSWWQQVKRSLTPQRWRKPLKPIREARPSNVEIRVGEVSKDVREQFDRAQANLAKAGEIIDGLIRSEPDPPK